MFESFGSIAPMIKDILKSICVLLIVMVVISCIDPTQQSRGIGSGREPAVLSTREMKTGLNDVIGLKEVKHEIWEYIDFFNNRDTYKKRGCKLPKGLLFVGPPGTGKTLLAKAIAKEAGNCSFINVEVSTLNEVYVGVGAARIKKIFDLARQSSPCIIFMDEIDTIGGKRGQSSNNENTSVLNGLLTQMDGFDLTDDILVIAATNRVEQLDPALLRSGRFDCKITFDLPNKRERAELFKYYIDNIRKISKGKDDYVAKFNDSDYTDLATKTPGCSGADIANIVNRAAIETVYQPQDLDSDCDKSEKKRSLPKTASDQTKLTVDKTIDCIDRILIGTKRPSLKENNTRTITDDSEIRMIAYHEAGHALMSHLLRGSSSPIKVSIVPRSGGILGYSQSDPPDRILKTKAEIISEIMVLMGGRAAEEFMFGSEARTTGAIDDIQRATRLIHGMYFKYALGDSANPFMTYVDDESNISGVLSDSYKNETMLQIRKFQNVVYDFVKQTLSDNKSSLDRIAQQLIENEEITDKTMVDIPDANSITVPGFK